MSRHALFGQIRVDSFRPNADYALALLTEAARLIAPLMLQRRYHVPVLAELSPFEKNECGWNVGHGKEIFIALRDYRFEQKFLPLEIIIDILLHEISHIGFMDHGSGFQALYREHHADFAALRVLDPPTWVEAAPDWFAGSDGPPNCRTELGQEEMCPVHGSRAESRHGHSRPTHGHSGHDQECSIHGFKGHSHAARRATTEDYDHRHHQQAPDVHYESPGLQRSSTVCENPSPLEIPRRHVSTSSRHASSSRSESSSSRGSFTRKKGSSSGLRFSIGGTEYTLGFGRP